jgi:proteasome lid subunit RPN8/RPN11
VSLLVLPRPIRRELARAAHAAAPAEACGVLIGRRDGDDTLVVAQRPARNLSAAPRHGFTVAPADLARAVAAARRDGFAIVGFYHSHPPTPSGPAPATPSAADLAGGWDDSACVVVAPDPRHGEAATIRGFRLAAGRATEALLVDG